MSTSNRYVSINVWCPTQESRGIWKRNVEINTVKVQNDVKK